MLAWQEGRLASDIVEEHKKLKEADIVIFQVRLLFEIGFCMLLLGALCFFVSFAVSHVLVLGSCHHERLDGSGSYPWFCIHFGKAL